MWNGHSLPSEVHQLKKGNVKPVKSSFNEEGLNHRVSSHKNGSFKSHQTHKSNDQCVMWYSL